MKKVVASFILILVLFIWCLNFFPYMMGSSQKEDILVEFTGQEGDSIFAEFILDDETVTKTATLPASFEFQSNNLSYKAALLDYQNAESFSISVKKGDKVKLSSTGRGVYGEFKSTSTHINLLLFHYRNSSSSTNSSTLADEEIESFLYKMM